MFGVNSFDYMMTETLLNANPTNPKLYNIRSYLKNKLFSSEGEETIGLVNDSALVDQGYCSKKVSINSTGTAIATTEGGKCSNCDETLSNSDAGRTYLLIDVDDSSMEGGYMISSMRQGEAGNFSYYESLNAALTYAMAQSTCYVLGSVLSIDNGAILGCIDSTATNYDDTANEDDQSCIYCKENEILNDLTECVCKDTFEKNDAGNCVPIPKEFDFETHIKKYGLLYGFGTILLLVVK